MAIEKTRLKFTESKQTGEVVGFVSRNSKTKQLRGVDESSLYGKRICVLSEDLKDTVTSGVIYDVELKPMHKKNGYVVVSAVRPTFEAVFETVIVPKAVYQIKITFGHKVIWFDPIGGKSRSSRTVAGVEQVLAGREDLGSKDVVLERFRDEAVALLRTMESDGMIEPMR